MLEKASLFLEVYEVNKIFTELMNKVYAKYKINQVQFLILLYSVEDEEMNVTHLSQKLKLSRSAVSQALVCLQIKKLITRTPAKDNRKVFYVTPTLKAKRIVKEFKEGYDLFNKKLIEIMGDDKITHLTSLLNVFNDTLIKLNDLKGDMTC